MGVRSQHRLRNGRQLQCERSGWGEREKQPFWHDFLYKPNVLPRQARDKHGKSGQKGKPVSVGEGRYCPAAECEGGENDREGGRDGDLEWRLR